MRFALTGRDRTGAHFQSQGQLNYGYPQMPLQEECPACTGMMDEPQGPSLYGRDNMFGPVAEAPCYMSDPYQQTECYNNTCTPCGSDISNCSNCVYNCNDCGTDETPLTNCFPRVCPPGCFDEYY